MSHIKRSGGRTRRGINPGRRTALAREMVNEPAGVDRALPASRGTAVAEKEHERLLREIEAQHRLFQTVIDNVPTGVAVLRGGDFVFELVNPAFQAMAPGKVMLGKTVAEVWPEIASQVLPLLEGVLSSGEPYHATNMSFLIQRAPGAPLEERFFSFSNVLVHNLGEGVDGILVVAYETTEEVRAREMAERLAEVSQRQAAERHAVLENMVEAVLVCDAAGHITLANEAGVRLLGLTGLGEVQLAVSDFPERLRMRHLDGRPVEPAEMALARALAGETIVQADEIIYNPQIQRDVSVRASAAPIRDEKGAIKGAVAVVRDVTELADLERLKDKFITVAAHELKTPTAIMKGYAQALLRTADDMPSPRRRMLDAINRGADRIDDIVKDLLDISRLHLSFLDLSLERIDLPELVHEVVDRMAATTTRHRIRVVNAEPVVVQGDRNRLEQVLTNLIDNAIRYSPRGGEMDVEVAVRDREAVVSVRDYGVGIPEEKQARIFERFYRAHTGTPYDYGGMGVGLYISREIVLRHGGRMWFESGKDGGTTFYFSLPL